jgi:hypothetical protein
MGAIPAFPIDRMDMPQAFEPVIVPLCLACGKIPVFAGGVSFESLPSLRRARF